MKRASELLLTFLLNAAWQVALVAVVASLGDRLLRRTAARHRHLLWVVALGMSLVLPLVTSWRAATVDQVLQGPTPEIASTPLPHAGLRPSLAPTLPSTLRVNQQVAWGLVAVYLLFLVYRSGQLFRAWARTLRARRVARLVPPTDRVHGIVATCRKTIPVTGVRIFSSSWQRVPTTIGVLRPWIVLPEELLREASPEILTAAIGHEMAHVRRSDYLFNLIYEICFLPLSFHPAAALMKRRIAETRELSCDHLVADRLLRPEVYARSLVELAGVAMPLLRRGTTLTVGIADADILEVRIMSLLKRTTLNTGSKRWCLVAAAALLAIPCAAAAAFAVHFHMASGSSTGSAAGPFLGPQENQGQEDAKRAERDRERRELEELKKRASQDPHGSHEFDGSQFELRRELQERERRSREEQEQRTKQQAVLARMAKVTMDQAIQIAVSQQPGSVLQCSLVGEHWEAPGKLAKDGLVLYHVVIFSGDEASPVITHVLINALDGTVLRNSREEGQQEPSSRPRL